MPTKIEWTDETWNPVTGCTPVSAGCDHCYARRMANRLRGRYGYPQDDPFKVTLHPERVDEYVDLPNNHPYRWGKPRMIFVCSMGDFFHSQVPLEFQARMLNVMVKCPQHIFIILTKRHKQLASFNRACGWSAEAYPNIWLGVSVEDQKTADERILESLKVQAAVTVVSYEPALNSLVLPPEFLERGKRAWCIVGGETGPGARPMNPEWARQVRDQCVAAGIPFFFKQQGIWTPLDFGRVKDGSFASVYSILSKRIHWFNYDDGTCEGVKKVGKKQAGRLLDGREWNQVPEI